MTGPTLTATERAAVEEWLRSEEAERRLAEAMFATFTDRYHAGMPNSREEARAILEALRRG